MNNDEVLELAKKCNVEITTYDRELLSYTFAIANLEAFAQEAIEHYKASLIPVGVVTDYLKRIEFFNYSSELEGEILYALGETK